MAMARVSPSSGLGHSFCSHAIRSSTPSHGHRTLSRRRRRGTPQVKAQSRGRGGQECSRQSSSQALAVASGAPRVCRVVDLSRELVPYETAWAWQKAEVQRKLAHLTSTLDARLDANLDASLDARLGASPGSAAWAPHDDGPEDVLLVLQHPPVYTMGTGSTPEHLKFPMHDPPAPLHITERGGEVTYHGPGQIVMYPILDLRRHQKDLHWYLRSLEEVVIRALGTGFGIAAERVPGMTGVWADGHKLAAIGVRVTRWVTFHGLALNVCTSLRAFEEIVPCGLTLPVGSVQTHLSRSHGVYANGITLGMANGDAADRDIRPGADAQGRVRREGGGGAVLDEDALLSIASEHLLAAFCEVFEVDCVPSGFSQLPRL